MDISTWLGVALTGGLLASIVIPNVGFGLLGDVIAGMVGALLGGGLIRLLGIQVPVAGLAGSILVASIGAVVLLVVLRVVRRGYRRTSWVQG